MSASIRPRLLAVVAFVSLVARTASAQSVDPQKLAVAQALFADAQAAMERKDWAVACPKLEEVTRLLPNGVGGLLTLAQCYEGAGKLATAWTTYLIAQSIAAQTNRPEQEKLAREKVEALKPKLSQILIVVPEGTRALPGLTIERDGSPVGAAMWSTPVPVDKGRHLVVAMAAGRARWEKTVDVTADGAQVSVEVDLTAKTPEPNADAEPKAKEAPAPPAAPVAPKAKPGFWTGLRVGGAVVGGVGLVGLGVGSAFGSIALSKKAASNADGHCVGNKCDAIGKAARSDGLDAATLSTAMFAVGGVALAGGITLIAVGGPGKPKAEAALRIGPGSVALAGVW